jgi:hypothetical protein
MRPRHMPITCRPCRPAPVNGGGGMVPGYCLQDGSIRSSLRSRADHFEFSGPSSTNGHRWDTHLKVRFAPDSPLEGDGFELPVPVRQAKLTRFCR